jgi:hypothetical protein
MDSEKQKKYLKSIFAHSGLYIIVSKNEYSTTKKMNVKIGIAGDFHDRFGAYLLCYPTGFHVLSLFLTLDKTQALRLERSIHKYLATKYKFIVTKHSHSEEISSLTLAEVRTLIDTIQANVGVVFGKGHDKIDKIDQINEFIFPYIDILPGIFLNENLAQGGTRIKGFHPDVNKLIDSNYMEQSIVTSLKKKKYNSVLLPKKGVKITGFAAIKPKKKTKKKLIF